MKIIKNTLFILFISSLILTSCEKEEYNQPIQEKIKGKWKLIQILTVGRIDSNSREFENFSNSNILIDISSSVNVNQDFELHPLGNYEFSVKFENYFDPIKYEAPNYNLIEFDNQKYVVEIGNNINGRILNLTTYIGVEKQLFFEEK